MKAKKLICTALAVVTLSLAANAASDNAIGARFGRGTEVSYQRALPGSTRLEVGVSWSFENYFGIRGSYHALHRNIKDGFNWYLGPDAYISLTNNPEIHARLQIGIEHDFNVSKVPLLLSLDIMPLGLQLIPDTQFSWDVGLSIRWTF